MLQQHDWNLNACFLNWSPLFVFHGLPCWISSSNHLLLLPSDELLKRPLTPSGLKTPHWAQLFILSILTFPISTTNALFWCLFIMSVCHKVSGRMWLYDVIYASYKISVSAPRFFIYRWRCLPKVHHSLLAFLHQCQQRIRAKLSQFQGTHILHTLEYPVLLTSETAKNRMWLNAVWSGNSTRAVKMKGAISMSSGNKPTYLTYYKVLFIETDNEQRKEHFWIIMTSNNDPEVITKCIISCLKTF